MLNMRRMFIGLLTAALATLFAVAEPARVNIKDAPLTLAPPVGYKPVGDGKSFRHESVNSVIEVSKVPAAYAEVIGVFTAEEMTKRGMRLVSKDNVTVDGRAALLLQVAENKNEAGILRWTLVLGDYQETFLVNGTFPKDEETTLSAPLRATLMGTSWTKREEADPFVNFRFTLSPTPKLTFAKELDTLLAFTSDGMFPLADPGAPMMVVGYEMNEERIADERSFAKEAFARVPHFEQTTENETNAITVAGLQGYETTGSGTHSESQSRVELYQLLLFGDGYHIFVLGRANAKWSGEFLPEFRAAARSLKMK